MAMNAWDAFGDDAGTREEETVGFGRGARASAHGFFANARRAFGRRETSIGVEGTMEAIVRDYEGRRERMAKELSAARPHGVRVEAAAGEAAAAAVAGDAREASARAKCALDACAAQ